jgi:hypothetical protein
VTVLSGQDLQWCGADVRAVHEVDDLDGSLPLAGGGASQPGDLRNSWETDPREHLGGLDRAGGEASVPAFGLARRRDLAPGQCLELGIQRLLVGFHGQAPLAAGFGDEPCGLLLRVQCVHRGDRAIQVEKFEQGPGRGDLVALLGHRDLAHDRSRAVCQSSDETGVPPLRAPRTVLPSIAITRRPVTSAVLDVAQAPRTASR